MKATFNFLLLLVLSVSLIACASATLDSSSLIYNNSAEYPPSSHSYGISNLYVDYVTVGIKGTSGDDTACIIYTYSDGSTSSSGCQKVPYISWNIINSANPQPNLIVTSVALSGGTHTYMKSFFAYGNAEGYTGTPITPTPGTQTDSLCGNNITNTGEECDRGLGNGILCTAGYGSSCNYCSSQCKIKTVVGEYCGDGILNTEFERCDDGNRIDNDGCSNECKKPFEVTVEDFVPMVWQCDNRVVYDDGTEPGRISEDGTQLVERINNYAFEGEQIQWKVLVMDKNGIEKLNDVYVTVDGNKESNCERININNNIGQIESFVSNSVTDGREIDPFCNARIDEEQITEFNPETMAYYLCTLTVETPISMYGQSDINVEVEDMDGQLGAMTEKETWFFNPTISLSVDGSISFENTRPGTSSYSDRVLVGNNADDGSGVLLDMFISGTDFYDSSSSGALCPSTNQLQLSNFAYHATNGAYATKQGVTDNTDAEGYRLIQYGTGFNDPISFYNRNEILPATTLKDGQYYLANVLAQNNKMALTFRLNLPEPCNGNFDSGHIYFWGEAI